MISNRRGRGRRRRPDGAAGFTLLEVLIAFSILSVMLIPILQVFGGGLGTTETARGYAMATLLARSKLAEIGLDGPLVAGITQGSFEQPGYRWRTDIARDESEVFEPEGEAGSDARRGRERDDDDPPARARSGFGNPGGSSSSFGSSRFGDSESRSGSSRFSEQSGFGQGTGSSGRSGSGFGRQGGGGLSGRSTQFGGGQSGRGAAQEEGTLDTSAELIPYRVTVTVEWGDEDGSGAVSLSSLRISRPDDEGFSIGDGE